MPKDIEPEILEVDSCKGEGSPKEDKPPSPMAIEDIFKAVKPMSPMINEEILEAGKEDHPNDVLPSLSP
jgi:hypothetical protein